MVGILGYFGVDELKGLVDELKSIKSGIVEGYTARTKLDSLKLSKMMDDETWMTASEAIANGFADEIVSGSSKASYVNLASMQAKFVNIPRALLEPQQPAGNETERRAQRLAAQARSYLIKEK
jgi:ATP-dependent Clp protease protease subunit